MVNLTNGLAYCARDWHSAQDIKRFIRNRQMNLLEASRYDGGAFTSEIDKAQPPLAVIMGMLFIHTNHSCN